MDELTPSQMKAGEYPNGFTFHGSWQEFLPIAATNLLLTLVTLGIYRFWANARERRYLWSRTQVIDERLEWAGTGKEMFIGFLVVMAIFVPLAIVVQFVVVALVARGHAGIAGFLGFAAYAAIFYLVGLAMFRALRYRLSRTYWHGIRGGSDEPGWGYGWSWIWKSVVGTFLFGLMIPWAMCELWNERWKAMSFGPHNFTSGVQPGPVLKRLLACYGVGIVMLIMTTIALGGLMTAAVQSTGSFPPMIAQFLAAIIPLLITMPVFLICYAAYQAVFMREAIGHLSLAHIDFCFNARTVDWLKLQLGNFALVVFTLGLGFVFLSYRNWSFYVRHLEAHGEIDLARFTQSTTPLRTDAEGLAGAFDIGAI